MPESRYRIIERVAAGGMAEVFRGVAESLQGFRKNIAIKRVLPSLSKNKKFIAMFLDEARLSLGLQHANIVQVFDIGHADDTYFIVMEYVEGVDLKAVLEWRRRIGKPLTIGQTVYIILEVCKGLAYAHDLGNPDTGEPIGIVHRDVSPPNVLLSRNGEVKVADFGLAKAAVQVEHTDPGVVKGKMSYLSPEAARGEDVDRRADIFAVGILLYEMLTNRRLFYGETDYQTVELVRAAKVPPIGAQNREVEPELEDIVRKALARRLEDRFQSATDLQEALAHYLFSRGLKMLQRDIGDLARACLEDQLTTSGAVKKPKASVIDTLLHDEIKQFTSMDFEEPPAEPEPPPAPSASSSGDFVDPRAWADDADWPWRRTGGRRTANGPRRTTGAAIVPMTAEPSGPVNEGGARATRAMQVPQAAVALTLPSDLPMSPTPGPEALADALEPRHPASGAAPAPAAAAPAAHGMSRGVVIGVLLGALTIGAALAALVFRGG
jgi:serine/threonine-protein kinase